MLASDISVTGVARQINWNRRISINLQHYNVTGTILDRSRAGRYKVTTVGHYWQMALTHRRQRVKTSNSRTNEYGI